MIDKIKEVIDKQIKSSVQSTAYKRDIALDIYSPPTDEPFVPPTPSGCDAGGACSEGGSCESADKGCAYSYQCPEGQECIDNICVGSAGCTTPADCPGGMTCLHGECVTQLGCEGVVCPDGFSCVNGVCVLDDEEDDDTVTSIGSCADKDCSHMHNCSGDRSCQMLPCAGYIPKGSDAQRLGMVFVEDNPASEAQRDYVFVYPGDAGYEGSMPRCATTDVPAGYTCYDLDCPEGYRCYRVDCESLAEPHCLENCIDQHYSGRFDLDEAVAAGMAPGDQCTHCDDHPEDTRNCGTNYRKFAVGYAGCPIGYDCTQASNPGSGEYEISFLCPTCVCEDEYVTCAGCN